MNGMASNFIFYDFIAKCLIWKVRYVCWTCNWSQYIAMVWNIANDLKNRFIYQLIFNIYTPKGEICCLIHRIFYCLIQAIFNLVLDKRK